VKAALNTLACLIALATLAVWVATGAHRGWTQTTVTVMETDEVTGLQYPVPHKKFVMGVELLGLGLAAAATMSGIALFVKSKPKPERDVS
jgi:hypothetical protein